MISPTLLYRGTVAASATTVATTVGNGTTTINSIVATNRTANARVFSITAGGFYLAYQMPLAAGQTVTLDVRQVCLPSTVIQAWADAATSVDVAISGAVQTGVPYIGSGTGSPEGVITANVGSEWQQTDDSQLGNMKWVKLSGTSNTGWYPDFQGRWKTWTPSLSQSVTPTQTVQYARYTQSGREVTVQAQIAPTGSGTANQKVLVGGLPVNVSNAEYGQGTFRFFDSGNTNFVGASTPSSASSLEFHHDGNGNYFGSNMTVTNGDVMHFLFTYEAA